MEARAIAKFVRLAPRKVRQVIDLVDGKKVDEALAILRFTPQRAAKAVAGVVTSAVANAEHNYEADRDDLVITKAYVDQGPVLKRWKARAFGRAHMRRSRTSHITIVVSDGKEG